jgi:hypothetical protein
VSVPNKIDGIELSDPFDLYRVAVMPLPVDPSAKSWEGGSVVLIAGNQTMAVVSLESLQLMELGIPACFIRIPDKIDGIELPDPICTHRAAPITLLVDPVTKAWVFGVVLTAGNQTMAVLSLESLQLVELGKPFCFLLVPGEANGIELPDPFCIHRVAPTTLVGDPGAKSRVFYVVLGTNQTMAVVSLESLQLVELGTPGCFLRIPDKTNGIQLLATVS